MRSCSIQIDLKGSILAIEELYSVIQHIMPKSLCHHNGQDMNFSHERPQHKTESTLVLFSFESSFFELHEIAKMRASLALATLHPPGT